MKTDANIKSIVVASIRRHSMEINTWVYTQLWDSGNPDVTAELSLVCVMEANEVPVLYLYIDSENWTLVTTRRVLGSLKGEAGFAFAKDITESNSGNFKGYGQQEIEHMRIVSKSGESFSCPFETGKASMGTIYAVQTLRQITEP